MKLVSVIVPVYNVDNYLSRCIESILMQSYSNLQILLVDDGSTDNSGLICHKYALIDKRIRVISKKNGGLSDARNCGLKFAIGQFIAFVDGDDYIDVNYIFSLMNIIESNHADVAVCGFYVHHHGKLYSENVESSEQCITGRDLLGRIMGKKGYRYVVVWNKIYKKDLFKDCTFEKGRLYEDEYICSKLFWKVKKVCISDQVLYHYFQRKGSITSSSVSRTKLEMKKDMYEKRIAFFEYHNDMRLVMITTQVYKNWIVETLGAKESRKLLSVNEINELRKKFKTMVLISFHNSHQNILERGQDLVGLMNLTLAVKIKHILLLIRSKYVSGKL